MANAQIYSATVGVRAATFRQITVSSCRKRFWKMQKWVALWYKQFASSWIDRMRCRRTAWLDNGKNASGEYLWSI